MISGYGQTDTHRIGEGDLRARAYGAKLNIIWTLGIKKDGRTYFRQFMTRLESLMREDTAMNKNEMDEMMNNFKKGKVSKPVDLSDF